MDTASVVVRPRVPCVELQYIIVICRPELYSRVPALMLLEVICLVVVLLRQVCRDPLLVLLREALEGEKPLAPAGWVDWVSH